MFQEILYAIVGPWGRAAIEWMLAHPLITGTGFLIWTVLLVAGKAQLRRIEARTLPLVFDESRQMLAEQPGLTAEELYDRLYPAWCRMVRRTAWFVPHRWEIWPLPASPRIVRDRIGFTPHWVVQRLSEQGIHLRGSRPKGKTPEGGSAGNPRGK
jgi:hypothetical protein